MANLFHLFFLCKKFGDIKTLAYFCNQKTIVLYMEKMTKENALSAWKKALQHKKEAGQWFEKWLKERGIEGKVVSL